MGVPVVAHHCQHFLLSIFFWIFDILVLLQQNFIVVLLCFLLMTSDVKHHFVNLFAIQKFPLVNCPFRSLTHFKIYSSSILYNYYMLYVLYPSLLSNIICKYFLPVSILFKKCFNFDKAQFINFFFHGFCCWFLSKNSSPEQMPCICYPIVYS